MPLDSPPGGLAEGFSVGGFGGWIVLSLALLDSKVAELDETDKTSRLQHAARFIRSQLMSESRGVVEVGRELERVHGILNCHAFRQWLRQEFAWSRPTASRYMSVARTFGECTVLDKFQASALYALSQTAVSPVARQQALQMAEQGLPVSRKTALTLIRQHADAATASRPMGYSALYNRAIRLTPEEILHFADALLHHLDTVTVPTPAASTPARAG